LLHGRATALSVPNTSSVAVDQLGRGSVTPRAMITGHVSAVRVPAGDAAGRVVVAVPAGGILEGRGDTAAAPPAYGSAATARGAAEAVLGGPGADRRDPARPPGQPA